MSRRLLLEVNPSSCILVIGPHLTSSVHQAASSSALTLSHYSLLRNGIRRVGKIFENEEQRLLQLLDTDFSAATKETVNILASHGEQEEWLKMCCSTEACDFPVLDRASPLQQLKSLQSRGCRLVYTYYDNILDTALSCSPILPTGDAHKILQWTEGEKAGILHINGIYNNTSSIILQPGDYGNRIANSSLSLLKEFFRSKAIICIGHDPDHFNPLMTDFAHCFLEEDKIVKNPPLYLSSTVEPLPPCFLLLPTTRREENTQLHHIIGIGEESNFSTEKQLYKNSDKDVFKMQLLLIFNEKQSFRKLGDIIYQLSEQSGEIYVRRDALTVLFGRKILYGNVMTYGGNGLHRMWDLAFNEGSVLQRKGLVALKLRNAIVVWLKGKPTGLSAITGIRTFHSLWNNNQITSAHSTSPSSSSTSSSPTLSLSLVPQSVAIAEPSSTLASLSSPTVSSFSPSPPPVSLLGLYPHLLNQFLSYQISYPSLSPFIPVLNPAAMPYLPYLQLHSKQSPTAVSTAQEATSTQSPHSQSGNDSTDDTVSTTDTNSIASTSVLLMAKSPEKLDVETSLEVPITPVALNTVLADSSKEPKITTQPSFQYSPGRLSSSASLFSRAGYGMQPFLPLLSPPAKPAVLLSPTHFSYLSPTLPFTPTFQPLSTTTTTIIHSTAASHSSQYSSAFVASSTSTTLSSSSSSQPSSLTNNRKRKADEPNQSTKRHASSSDNDSDTENCQMLAMSKSPSTFAAGSQLDGEQGKRQSGLHLLQFLLHLLFSLNHGSIIQWTGANYEFCIIDPDALTSLWAAMSGDSHMTFNSLQGELNAYSALGLLERVQKEEATYRFLFDVNKYLATLTHLLPTASSVATTTITS